MNRPSALTLTLTGADEHTSLYALLPFAAENDIEMGLLYTVDPEGRPRYPSRDWLARTLNEIATYAPNARLALHVCGRRAQAQLFAGDLADLTARPQRIQVNGVLTAQEVEQVCARYPSKTLITQHTKANLPLATAVKSANHALLVDGSGGQGVVPDIWSAPIAPRKTIGFAGGLTAENLGVHLPRIRRLVQPGAWIDMESGLRRDDWFDVHRAEQAVIGFRQILQRERPSWAA